MGKKLLLIINPKSGKCKAKKVYAKIMNKFAEAGYEVNLKFTSKYGDAKIFACDENADLVVCVGGDGTLNETINGIMESQKDITLGYIPMGSTNDFASSMKVPKNWKKAVDAIISGEERKIDICKFGDRYFGYVAAHGMFSDTSYSTSQKIKNRIGRLAYFLLGVKDVFKKNNWPIKLKLDDELIDDEFAFIGFGNTKSIGGILKFSDSDVEMTDGLFEVFLVKYPKSLFQLSRMLKRFNSGKWQGDGLKMYQTKKVEILTNEEQVWSLDGEKHTISCDTVVKIIPSAIKMRVKDI